MSTESGYTTMTVSQSGLITTVVIDLNESETPIIPLQSQNQPLTRSSSETRLTMGVSVSGSLYEIASTFISLLPESVPAVVPASFPATSGIDFPSIMAVDVSSTLGVWGFDLSDTLVWYWPEMEYRPLSDESIQDQIVFISVPGLFKAKDMGPTHAQLTWAASSGGIGILTYRIYQDDVLIDTTTNLLYYVSGLMVSVPYEFKIQAVDTLGNTSEKTEGIIVTPSGRNFDFMFGPEFA